MMIIYESEPEDEHHSDNVQATKGEKIVGEKIPIHGPRIQVSERVRTIAMKFETKREFILFVS